MEHDLKHFRKRERIGTQNVIPLENRAGPDRRDKDGEKGRGDPS